MFLLFILLTNFLLINLFNLHPDHHYLFFLSFQSFPPTSPSFILSFLSPQESGEVSHGFQPTWPIKWQQVQLHSVLLRLDKAQNWLRSQQSQRQALLLLFMFPHEDQAACVLHLCMGPSAIPCMFFRWWLRLSESLWAQAN